jgi:hypothetical protein
VVHFAEDWDGRVALRTGAVECDKEVFVGAYLVSQTEPLLAQKLKQIELFLWDVVAAVAIGDTADEEVE